MLSRRRTHSVGDLVRVHKLPAVEVECDVADDREQFPAACALCLAPVTLRSHEPSEVDVTRPRATQSFSPGRNTAAGFRNRLAVVFEEASEFEDSRVVPWSGVHE